MLRKCLYIGLTIVLLAVGIGVIGCGAGGSSPESVVKSYYKAINDGEFVKAKSYTEVGGFAQQIPEEFKANIEKLEIVRVQTGTALGTKLAGVEVKITLAPAAYSGSWIWHRENTQTVTLEKTDQGWKIFTVQ